MFYRIGQKITSVGDLAQAELFSFSMGSSNTAYCTLNPMTNGTYHLAAHVANPIKSLRVPVSPSKMFDLI